MGLRIEINICERGSVTIHHVGNLPLLHNHYRTIDSMMERLAEDASLGVNPRPRRMNVLERYIYGVPRNE